MAAMDERIPGGGTSTMPPGMGGGNFLQMLAAMMSGGGRSSPQGIGVGGGGVSPARVGAVPNPPQVPNVGGLQPSSGVAGPAAATAQPGATEGGPGRFAPISPAGVNTQTEFATKSGRNMAITQNALSGIGQFVQQYKQGQFQKKVQAAKAAVLQKVMMSQDPQAQQQIQKLSQSDPKMAKIFEKQQADFAKYYDKAMTDPNSPEYYGFQQAYQELQSQAAMRDKMDLIKAQIQAEQQRGQQEAAHAKLYERQTELEGTVTPAKQAELEAQGRRVHEQVAGSLQRTMVQSKTAIATTKTRADAYKYAADKMAASRVAGAKTPQDKTLENMAKEYKNLHDQWDNLQKQAKDLQDNIAKAPVTSWLTGASKQAQGQVQAIQAQQAILSKQMDDIEQKRRVMEEVGALPSEEDINAPSGDEVDTEPITVNPEDMEPTKPSAGIPK